MSKKNIQIVANAAAKHALGLLGNPVVQVAVNGHVVSGAGGNTLVISNVSTSRSATLPIVAGPAAKKALAASSGSTGSCQITLLGRVVHCAGGNTLVLDQVGKTNQMAISADRPTRKLISDLAGSKNGEMYLTAKVVNEDGNKVLVLAGECCGKKK